MKNNAVNYYSDSIQGITNQNHRKFPAFNPTTNFSLGSTNDILLKNVDFHNQSALFNTHDLITSDDSDNSDIDSDDDLGQLQSDADYYKSFLIRKFKQFILFFHGRSMSFYRSLFALVFILILIISLTSRFNTTDVQNYDSIFTKKNTGMSTLHKLIIPNLDEMFPNLDLELSPDLFDPRLTPSLLLLYLQHQITLINGKLNSEFSIPFSWADWIDLDTRLKYEDSYLIDWLSLHSADFLNQLDDLKALDCETFAMFFGCEGNHNFYQKCSNLNQDEILNNLDYPYKFKINGPTDAKIKESGRLLYSGSYLKFSMPPPERLFLLDVFGPNGEGSLMVNVDQHRNLKRNKILKNHDVIKNFINWELIQSHINIETFIENGWSVQTIRRRFSNILGRSKIEKIIPQTKHYLINEDETYLAIKDEKITTKMKVSNWKFNDFLWDEAEFLSEMNNKIDNINNNNETYDYKLWKGLEKLEKFRIENGYHPKYLAEAQLYGTNLGSHFDWRFFSGSFILNDYRQSVIHRLSRTWLRFCFENNIKTFIAYGSMLGWIRNGLTLPWDGDIDVIVTMESLNLLARNFNQTLIVDYSGKDGFQSAMTGYLIDINPAYYSRVKGDGNNVIDGRLIDISTGIYLDITALSWTKGYLDQVEMLNQLKKLVDKDFEMNQFFAVEGEIYGKTLMDQLSKLQADKQLVHCKNDNVYTIDELSIMIPSYFEGVRAYFPHAYEDIIWRLYPKALTRITEPDHVFDDVLRLWVNINDCPDFTDLLGRVLPNAPFGTCTDSKVMQEYNLTKAYTSRHLKMLEKGAWDKYELDEITESKPLRIDEFFVLYGDYIGLTEDELEQLYM